MIEVRQLRKDFGAIRNEMNRVFGSFGSGFFSRGCLAPVNVYESAEEYLVVLEAPGADKETFSISLTGDQLSIKGVFKDGAPEGSQTHRAERACGDFHRSVELPGRVDGSKVDASFHDGLLTVRVAKAEEQRPKMIEVQVG